MDVMISEILELPELQECRLLTPEVSCSQQVKSVTIMDNPDILSWMSENELLLSNGSSLVDLNPLEWKAFLSGLVQKKAAALFIKLNYYVKRIPPEAISHAQDLDFPIVVIPNNYSWVKLSDPIQQFMIAQQFYYLNESLELRNTLNQAIAQGSTVSTICELAAQDIGSDIAVFSSEDGQCQGGTQTPLWHEVSQALQKADGSLSYKLNAKKMEKSGYVLETSDANVLLSKLPDKTGKYYSALHLHADRKAIERINSVKMEQVNSALLLTVCKEEELRRIERHYYINFLSELIDGDLKTQEEIEEKATRLGRKVHKAYQLIVIRGKEETIMDSARGLLELFKQHHDPGIRDVMYYVRNPFLILFYPVFLEENKKAIEEICSAVRPYLSAQDPLFGVSRVYPITAAHEAFREALLVSSLQPMASSGRIVYYEELGLLRLLERNSHQMDIHFMSDFYEQVMGKLMRSDEESGSDLIKSLRAYFDNDSSIPRTAAALFVHENTLRMRLKRIENLSGRSLKNTKDLFELYLGSLIHQFIP